MMAEELRLLYVAMTRAKEKLFITAGDRYLGRHVEKWGGISGRRELPFTFLSAAGSYLDWLLMASENARASLSVTCIPAEELLKEAARSQAWKAGTYLELKRLREEGDPCPPEVLEQLCRPYSHEADIGLHAKMSVSELKEQGQFVDDGESDFLPTVPAFLRKGEEEEREQGLSLIHI